jgi:starch synthase
MPCLLEAHYRPYGHLQHLRTILTIHNLKFQGIHSRDHIADLMDLPERFLTDAGILKDGMANFLKAGIVYADHVTTVSPTYAGEIMTEDYGEGLHHLLQSQAFNVEYDPARDPHIPAFYDQNGWMAGKTSCKAALQQEIGLNPAPGLPLACMVTRLTDQKGLDLLLHILDEMMTGNAQLAILGTGEPNYENALKEYAVRYPGWLAVRLEFNGPLSHRFYAGADLLLMPSLFEPCGLAQMIAMRYGTLPVVRETGGLKDTVLPFDILSGTGNGFTFCNSNAHEFLLAVRSACDLYHQSPEAWRRLVGNAMAGDYSWKRSAAGYLKLYREVTA